ncbi:MAG: hypothetical protein GQ555_07840 [Desulfobacterales bacterium]|nr:hypothetical protein [Desulfobacterales bacterium]
MVDFQVMLLAVVAIAIVVYYAFRDRIFTILENIYMKMDPPADVDKAGVANPPIVNDNSCFMATAANMLAGAGYGNGTTLQDRANDIYNDLIAWQTDALNPTGLAEGGWTDTALSWWLSSNNNNWPNNPYKVVTVYGNKAGPVELHRPKPPWNNANGAQFIANELRRCQMLGLSISWPTNAVCNDPAHIPANHPANHPIIGSGGHAITCWGDNGRDSELNSNPGKVRITDSDRDDGGNVTMHEYDSYTNPNPGGANEGNGWYFDYTNNHPYIKHIVTLCPTDDPTDATLTQKVTGSFTLHQFALNDATDLHYEVGTDVNILTYKTTIDWNTTNKPEITEDSPRRNLTVDWDLSDKPVPHCTDITITTEFILPLYNAIWYRNVGFTYPGGLIAILVDLKFLVQTPLVPNAERIRDVSGGYVIGAFDIMLPEQRGERGTSQFRFIHEYSFNQNPEEHVLLLSGNKDLAVTNIRIGHSYGYLMPEELWKFEDWMTKIPREVINLREEPAEIKIDWDGRLPYPQGEDITGIIPDKKTSLLKRKPS